MAPEKRLSSRLNASLFCRYCMDGSSRLKGRIRNISPEGMFIEAKLMPDPNCRVSVFLELDGQELHLSGRVRQDPGNDGFGVQFTSTGSPDLQRLSDLLSCRYFQADEQESTQVPSSTGNSL